MQDVHINIITENLKIGIKNENIQVRFKDYALIIHEENPEMVEHMANLNIHVDSRFDLKQIFEDELI